MKSVIIIPSLWVVDEGNMSTNTFLVKAWIASYCVCSAFILAYLKAISP
jgi:hypothetical protein